MTENALSILSVIFSIQLQQTEISERKLFIFHLGPMHPGTALWTIDDPSLQIWTIEGADALLVCRVC